MSGWLRYCSPRRIHTSSLFFSVRNHASEKEFNREVDAFLQKRKLDLPGIFQDRFSRYRSFYEKDFFSNPTIASYLGRNSQSVHFFENKPNIVNVKEMKIYELTKLQFPYRIDVLSDAFYLNGSKDPTIFQHIVNLNSLCKIRENAVDMYHIRKTVNQKEFGAKVSGKKEEACFFLFPLTNNSHATSIIAIFHKETGRHLVSIFINSFKAPSYYKYVESCFNSPRFVTSLFFGAESKKVASHILKRFAGRNGFIDYVDREGYTLNSTGLGNRLEDRKLWCALEKKEIDVLYNIRIENGKEMTCETHGNRIIPFLDASHHLQTEDEDQNCSLYSFNFLQAVAVMLNDPSMAEKVYGSALQVDTGIDSDAGIASLTKIFSEDLKRYLPEYYDANGRAKEYAAIKSHHLRQRWDLGGKKILSKMTSVTMS